MFFAYIYSLQAQFFNLITTSVPDTTLFRVSEQCNGIYQHYFSTYSFNCFKSMTEIFSVPVTVCMYFKVHVQRITCYVILSTSLCPEGAENMPLGSQVSDLCFQNQNCIRNSKMGPKQSVAGPTEWSFFQITFFGTKNHRKNDIFELQMGFLK